VRQLPRKLLVLSGRHHYSALEELAPPEGLPTQAPLRVVFQSEQK
jgi:hypothetical protein